MKTHLAKYSLFFAMLLFMACSCSTFTVETTEDGIAQAHAEVQAVYDTIASLKTKGVITSAERDSFVASVLVAEEALGTARLLLQAGDIDGSASNIGIAKSVLIATIAALEAKDNE